MAWTVVDDEPNINVRAVINPATQPDELKALIIALVKRHPALTEMSTLHILLEHKRDP